MHHVSFTHGVSVITIALLLGLFLLSCDSELPPEPSPPGEVDLEGTVGAALYHDYTNLGWAPPVDIFDDPDQLIYDVSPDVIEVVPGAPVSFNAEVNHPGALVYKYGYTLTSDGFVRFEFPQASYEDSNWIESSSSESFTLPQELFAGGRNFVVTYSCKIYDNDWKCGCADEDECGRWMMQDFLLHQSLLPPEPLPPGEHIITEVYVGANGVSFEEGENISLWADLRSFQDIRDQLQNPRFMVSHCDGDVCTALPVPAEQVVLDCDNEIDPEYECSVSYEAISTLPIGQYVLSFTTDLLQDYFVHTSMIEVEAANPDVFITLTINGNIAAGEPILLQ